MPGRGGRVGGGGSRGGGFRAPRSSGSGFRGLRINFGDRAPRATSNNMPDTNTSTPYHAHYRPWLRRGISSPWGNGWRIVGIILGVVVLGLCACVGLGVLVEFLNL